MRITREKECILESALNRLMEPNQSDERILQIDQSKNALKDLSTVVHIVTERKRRGIQKKEEKQREQRCE